jgi:sugar/nucleoside kinase (ribokinase family)
LCFLDEEIKEYKWKKPSKIIDTHGCGDALAGGNLFTLI